MTLYEIGEEYTAQSKIINERIKSLKAKLAVCSREEYSNLEYRIKELEAIYRDVRQIGNFLCRYYDTSKRKNEQYGLN